MSSQPPYDSARQQGQPTYGPPGASVPPHPPFEYIPIGAPQQVYAPMPRPAYLYPPLYPPVAPAAPASSKWPARGLALAGFILGLASIALWIVPCLGDVVAMLGMALSILGWRTHPRKWMAMAGVALSAAALLLGLCNSALGGYIFPH